MKEDDARLHICFASLDYHGKGSGGGVGTYVQSIGHELVRRGHRVTVIALHTEGAVSHEMTPGIGIHWFRPGRFHWYFSKLPGVGRLLALMIREIEYSYGVLDAVLNVDRADPIDILEATETGAAGLRCLPDRMRKVVRLHGDAYTFRKYTPPFEVPLHIRLSRRIQRWGIRAADCLTAPSVAHAREIEVELGFPPGRVLAVQNPIGRLAKTVLRSESTWTEAVFLFVGRIERVKGVLDLLRAIPAVSRTIPSATFLFAGKEHPSISRNEIDGLVEELGIGSRVKFLGHLIASDLLRCYREAAVITVPSYYETFGYVYLEARLAGKPVVAFDTGSVRDFVENGKDGFIVPRGDVTALSDACIKALSLRPASVSSDFLARFEPETVAKRIIDVYRETLVSC